MTDDQETFSEHMRTWLLASGFKQRGSELKADNCQVSITARADGGWDITIESTGTIKCSTPHLAMWPHIPGPSPHEKPPAEKPQGLTESQISERLDWIIDAINDRMVSTNWRLIGIKGVLESADAGVSHYNDLVGKLLAQFQTLCEVLGGVRQPPPQPPAPVVPFPAKPGKKSKRTKRPPKPERGKEENHD
jgi:hypothetical protein